MGLLSGAVSVTRFNVPARPEEIDFEQAAFRAIAPGSEVRESVGFVPYEPGAEYEVGAGSWAFRVRIDKLRPDPTAVRERTKQLVAAELEASGDAYVHRRKRSELRQLAEEELIVEARPRSTIVECALVGKVLYVGTTAKNRLGQVITLLRRVGVTAEPKTPWVDRQEADVESDLVEMREPGESVLGCRFLRGLLGDKVLTFEPEAGRVVLQTVRARVSLAGEVLPDLLRYAERGAEILSAKLTTGEISFRLDGAAWKVSGLRVETERHDHWTEQLDERMEKIAAAFDLLEAKYDEVNPARMPAPTVREAAGGGGGRVVPIRS